MSTLLRDLLPMFPKIRSLLVGAFVCDEARKLSDSAKVLENAGSGVDSAGPGCIGRRTCFSGCDTPGRSWKRGKDVRFPARTGAFSVSFRSPEGDEV